MRVTVSGKSYSAAIEVSNVPKEENWPAPTWRRVGRGRQAVYDVDETMAEWIVSHLEDVGRGFVVGDDDLTRAEGRTLLRDVAKARAQWQPSR